MARSAAEVKEFYANSHGIENANPAIAYRSAFQGVFNDKVTSSQFHETFEVQAGTGAKAVGLLSQIASGLTSFFGGSLIGVAGAAVVEIDKRKKSKTLAGLSELKPAIESCNSRLHNFTEAVAEDLTILSLRKLENLDNKQAAKLAKEDAKFLLQQIAEGKLDHQIENSQIIGLGNEDEEEKQALYALRKSMVDEVAKNKGLNFEQEENLMKARVAAKNLSGKNKEVSDDPHNHSDLGKFTHAVIEHEHHQKEGEHHSSKNPANLH